MGEAELQAVQRWEACHEVYDGQLGPAATRSSGCGRKTRKAERTRERCRSGNYSAVKGSGPGIDSDWKRRGHLRQQLQQRGPHCVGCVGTESAAVPLEQCGVVKAAVVDADLGAAPHRGPELQRDAAVARMRRCNSGVAETVN